MDAFVSDITSIFDLINDNKDSKTILNTAIMSKQYLAYYLYRIFTKYILFFENALPSRDIKDLYKYLRIPIEHDKHKNYPLAGKMINDEQLLDIIILTEIDMFTKLDSYIKTLPNNTTYKPFYEFIKIKNTTTIIQDIIDLQKLIPGLSVAAIRPNYKDDNKLI
jgi:hypothetical protein